MTMSREIDVRDFTRSRVTPERATELQSLASEISERLPGTQHIRIDRFDATTGNPAVVVSEASPAESGNYVERALQHVQAISPALGLTAQAPEFVADPTVQETSSGA